MPGAVALIPARAGSERVPGKNVRPLAGHPLLAYSIAAARESELFSSVVVSTDSEEIAAIATRYGADVPALRPPEMATSVSPDFEWIRHMLDVLVAGGQRFELFSILRPTSPFRGAATIRAAWERLTDAGEEADSIRAVELCKQHPGKMWVIDGRFMRPLLEQPARRQPYHSSQYQSLPPVYVQNSSIEIAWSRVLEQHGDIAGTRVLPFLTEGEEGFSIDYPEDVSTAERLAEDVPLPDPERWLVAPGTRS
jgi:CMP-N,N'-diacetyllegionaminic acid synthase